MGSISNIAENWTETIIILNSVDGMIKLKVFKERK